MADSLGDLSLSDMKWLGKPADPMGSMQAGQNFAAKGQAMQQSKEMFPLKMEAARADIDYRTQATSLAKQKEGHLSKMNPLLVTSQQIGNQLDNETLRTRQFNNNFADEVRPQMKESYLTKAKILKDTADATITEANVKADQAELNYEMDKYLKPLKYMGEELGLIGKSIANRMLGHQADMAGLKQREQSNAMDREDAGREAYKVDHSNLNNIATMGGQTAVDLLENYSLGQDLSSSQREELEEIRNQLLKRPGLVQSRMNLYRREFMETEAANSDQSKVLAIGKKNSSHGRWFTNPNSRTQTGAPITDPDTGKLTPEGQVALENYNKYEQAKGKLTDREIEDIHNDLGANGINPGYDAVIGGDQFIPSQEMLKAMATKTSENLKAERAQFGANQTAEWQTKSGMKIKGEAVSEMDTDVFKSKLTHITARVNKLMEDGDMTATQAFTQAWAEAGAAGGDIQVIEGDKDLREKLRSGKLKSGDLYLNLADSTWKHAPHMTGTGGGGGGGGAPGTPGGGAPPSPTGAAQAKDLGNMGVTVKDQSDMKGFIAHVRGENLKNIEGELDSMTATDLLKEYKKSNGLRMMAIENEVKDLLPGMSLDPNETAMIEVMQQLEGIIKEWEGGKKPEELDRSIQYSGKTWLGRTPMKGSINLRGKGQGGVSWDTGLLTKIKKGVDSWNERGRYIDWADEKLRK